MTVSDFVLLNRSDRWALVDHLTAVLDDWRDAWFAGESQRVEVTLSESDDAAALASCAWRTGVLPGGITVSAGISPAPSQPLMSRLIGERARATGERRERPPIERELEQAAVDDLIARLLSGSETGDAIARAAWNGKPPSVESTERDRGCVVAHCRAEATEMFIVLHPRVTHDVLAAKSRPAGNGGHHLSTVRGVVVSRKVAAEVCVGGAELLLSELANLAVGDVIALDRRLAEPVRVKLAGGGDVCAGHLGVFQGRKAVQLTIIDSNNGV